MTRRDVGSILVIAGLAGGLLAAPGRVGAEPQDHTNGTMRRPAHNPSPVVADGPLSADDTAAIARRWGIRIDTIRVTAAGYMLDFRYEVVDARKAKPLFERKTKPVLVDESTGARMQVPVPPKTGALRNSNAPIAGKTYFMFFANPGRFIKPGSLVTVTIGAFAVRGIRVGADAADAAIASPAPIAHEEHAVTRPDAQSVARMMVPQPVIGGITLTDDNGRQVRLADVLAGDAAVMVNFIFTTCTTVCPVMSTGFARLQELLGHDSRRVKLISISIDPETDTVPALRSYAARHRARPGWQFFTGTPEASEAAQRAFNAFRGARVNHLPSTFLRRAANLPWEEIPGLASAQTLLRALGGGRGEEGKP